MNPIVVRAWRKVEGREMVSDCLMGSEFQFCKMKKLETAGGDGCTTL